MRFLLVLLPLLLAALAPTARASALDRIRDRGSLAWGADQEGGGPFVYPRDDAPDEVTGFEVDLAAKLAEYLGVEPAFTQGQWDRMPDMLRAGKVDVVLNGYELTPERLAVMDATIPYYVYGLQLLLRKGDPAFGSWESLRTGNARIGVLTGSAAETTMREFCAAAGGSNGAGGPVAGGPEAGAPDGGGGPEGDRDGSGRPDRGDGPEDGRDGAGGPESGPGGGRDGAGGPEGDGGPGGGRDGAGGPDGGDSGPQVDPGAATDHAGSCTVVTYDGSTDAMREVETGKLDATLQDSPIASFYAPRFPSLVAVGEPVAPGYYVIYVPKGERELVQALNEALVLLIRNGDLESIYRRYGIWDTNQAQLRSIAENARFFGLHAAASAAVVEHEVPDAETVQLDARKRGLEVVRSYGGVLVESAWMTLKLSFLSFPLAIGLGLLIAVGRMYGPGWVRAPLAAWVEFLRGTPVMLQLYFVFFLLPEVGITLPAFWCGVLGLAVNYSAYESEIYRAGLQAVPVGQMEAALSLGMSRATAVRRIIVPQAVRMVIPPVVNDFIALFKDTSVCSVITIVELTKRFSVLSMSTQATVELMALTALLYLAMSWPMSVISRRIEARLGQG